MVLGTLTAHVRAVVFWQSSWLVIHSQAVQTVQTVDQMQAYLPFWSGKIAALFPSSFLLQDATSSNGPLPYEHTKEPVAESLNMILIVTEK